MFTNTYVHFTVQQKHEYMELCSLSVFMYNTLWTHCLSSPSNFMCYIFPATYLLHIDWQCICIFTCVQCSHNASLTTSGGGLANRIKIRP